MSYLTHADAVCSYCRHPNEAEVWSAVDVKTDPELKEILLGGELNMMECAACKEVFYAEHFLLYHDAAAELMAFVYPQSYALEKSAWELKTKTDFELSQASLPETERLAYTPVTLFGMDALVFLVEEEEEAMIQGEIAALLSPGHDFKVRRFRPSVAREKRMPPALPYSNAPSPREAVLKGLAQLLSLNDRLSIYAKFHAALTTNPSLDVPA